MIKTQLELIQGDSKCWKIQLRRNNTPIDISGWLLFFTAKSDYTQSDDDALIAVTVLIPNNAESQSGIAYLNLSPSDTNIAVGQYIYDIKYQSTERETIATGDLTIIPTVTQRIS